MVRHGLLLRGGGAAPGGPGAAEIEFGTLAILGKMAVFWQFFIEFFDVFL